MTPKTKIFLVTKDPKTVSHIETVARNGSPIEIDKVFPEISHVPAYLDEGEPAAGIVDIDPAPQETLSELEELIRNYPKMCTVVISEQITQELILSAMQAGARHFLQKGSIHSELSGVMARLLTHTGAKRKTGSIMTVFSASGGCGATTIALNLAMEMHVSTSKPVLVIDLDRCYGAAAAYLDVKSEYGIDDVLTYEGRIDKHLIQSSSCCYKENFHVLLKGSGASRKTGIDIKPESLRMVLQACREAYAYTVIDAPRMDEQTVRELSEQSDFTIVVFQLTLKDLAFARSIISMFRTLGLPDEKIIPLANRFAKRGPLLRIDDGKRALGTDTMYLVRSDWRNAMRCLNKGQTLAEGAPRSAIRKDLRKLAAVIQEVKSEEKR
ncbi:MAG TPA: AAA family ATPase [Anaerohalosphaeraceae bacterium]|nr:AAA family ATPase [Phycisphaerae bacterium]HOK95445.1 AAA family ATPase [Anaerohalosphaeraceae bacterium]HOL30388.1 AAA family ATPase [Anaerohalosphaeraceae bacterium]HOM75751.1 AAA family ATPase [Anaerohalosphaeraceae bacterium]HPC64467.1 AAA family ATPase [Anaerohalosphaeraceae bacterium]